MPICPDGDHSDKPVEIYCFQPDIRIRRDISNGRQEGVEVRGGL